VEKDLTPRYDYALQAIRELPYNKWREYNPEDTVRFYALRLHEAGMIKSSPQKIIAQGASIMGSATRLSCDPRKMSSPPQERLKQEGDLAILRHPHHQARE
jgi:hypothetical protein